jgi:hypothetical protein
MAHLRFFFEIAQTLSVRMAASPDTALLGFLQSTYEAAANAGNCDRAALECAPGIPGVPRAIS